MLPTPIGGVNFRVLTLSALSACNFVVGLLCIVVELSFGSDCSGPEKPNVRHTIGTPCCEFLVTYVSQHHLEASGNMACKVEQLYRIRAAA